jgi:hypothetical protein
MLEKYTFRRDFPAGKRAFVRPSLINFVGDGTLLETDLSRVHQAKTEWEVLSYTVERDGFDAQDPARWKAFPKASEQLSAALADLLQRRKQ